jgi:Tfp pilus assembly protein PilE
MFCGYQTARPSEWRRQAGMTLVEVLMALMICGLTVGAIVAGYTFCIKTAEKEALSLAANARAMERMEATRSATWDTSVFPTIDQLISTNFPQQVVILDYSGSGAGVTYATNITQIVQISTNPPLRSIHVDCIWRYNQNQVMTNSVEVCRAPDA